jgi:hypothetical protein
MAFLEQEELKDNKIFIDDCLSLVFKLIQAFLSLMPKLYLVFKHFKLIQAFLSLTPKLYLVFKQYKTSHLLIL